MLGALRAFYRQLARLQFLRVPLHRTVWYYRRHRKPSSTEADKLFLIMRSIWAVFLPVVMGSMWAAFWPVGKIDPRYIAAKEIMARLAIREIAEDYDAAGVMPHGRFTLLRDPITKIDKADLTEAEHLLLDAIEDAPDFAEAHFALGTLLLERGERYGALAEYLLATVGRARIFGNAARSAIKSEAYHEAGLLLENAGLLKQAEYCQRRAIGADDGLLEARLAYARILAARGELVPAAHLMSLWLSLRAS
jgi:tetratricopeptide (TPR) repeat protein